VVSTSHSSKRDCFYQCSHVKRVCCLANAIQCCITFAPLRPARLPGFWFCFVAMTPLFPSWLMVGTVVLVSQLCLAVPSSGLTWFGPSDPSPEEATAAAAVALQGNNNNIDNIELPLCESGNLFNFRLDVDDEVGNSNQREDGVVVVEKVKVNGCLLDCQGHRIRSDVESKPVVTVRNGGIVQNCVITLAPITYGNEMEFPFNMNDQGQENDEWSAATGFLCDSGDCTLLNVSCEVSEEGRQQGRYFPQCIGIETGSTKSTSGARTVKIKGGSAVDDYSELGIQIHNMHDSPDLNSATGNMTIDSIQTTSVTIEDFEIRNQESDAIWIGEGVRSVRIVNCTLVENGESGIQLLGGYGVEFLAVMGGLIQDNGQHGIDVDQDDYVVEGSFQVFNILELLITGTIIEGNARDGVSIKSAYRVALDDVTVRENGDDGIDVKIVANVLLENVISESNDQNGFLSLAPGALVRVTDSLFISNGEDDGSQWERAGVYIELANEANISNTIATGNDQEGFYIYDVPMLRMTDVDAIANGNDGCRIERSEDGSSTLIHQVEFRRVRACSNGNDGIDLFSRNGWQIEFSPLQRVVACGNEDVDFVMRGGDGGVLFSFPFGFESTETLGVTADSCMLYPDEIDCYDSSFTSCSAELCVPRDPTIMNSGENLN
jgi:hypothetical protein